MRGFIASLFLALPTVATGDVAGDFDYYVLSLSWSPNWCAITGDARGAETTSRTPFRLDDLVAVAREDTDHQFPLCRFVLHHQNAGFGLIHDSSLIRVSPCRLPIPTTNAGSFKVKLMQKNSANLLHLFELYFHRTGLSSQS